MLKVLLPPGTTVLGLKLAFAPLGNPLNDKLMLPVYPKMEVVLTV